MPTMNNTALLKMEGGIILLIATCILHEINSNVVDSNCIYVYLCMDNGLVFFRTGSN